MEPLAQGRVWLGAQAKQNGLVDELGGLDSAIDLIKRRANIAASEKVTLVTYPPRRTLFDLIWNRSDDASQLESALGVKARALLGRLPIRSLTEGGILRLMPYSIEVK
jgi:protease-4